MVSGKVPAVWPGWAMPGATAAVSVAILAGWLWAPWRAEVPRRVPGTDRPASAVGAVATRNVFAQGTLESGPGKPAAGGGGAWAGFRGGARDGVVADGPALASAWGAAGPRKVWDLEVGEGYAGPAIAAGRVYLMDYDREKQRDALRCLSLEDGREIWRYSYPMAVKRNHGLTRTVPTVAGGAVVAMGPKAHTICVEPETGRFRWGLDLVNDFGATVPPWYTGQCPLVDGDAVILAPGGDKAAMIAVSLATGEVRWRATHEAGWKMSHASIVPMDLGGTRFYLYPASGGVLAVRARDGQVAWASTEWKINIATVPSPVVIGEGRVLFTGGYNAGSLMLEFSLDGEALRAREVFRVRPDVFGATQHSPVFQGGHFYGVRADGRLVSLSPSGTVNWTSGDDTSHGLGPVMIAGGMIYALAEGGRLSLVRAEPGAYTVLAKAEVMEGHECWAPLAMADGRLLVRDMTRMVCLDVAATPTASSSGSASASASTSGGR